MTSAKKLQAWSYIRPVLRYMVAEAHHVGEEAQAQAARDMGSLHWYLQRSNVPAAMKQDIKDIFATYPELDKPPFLAMPCGKLTKVLGFGAVAATAVAAIGAYLV